MNVSAENYGHAVLLRLKGELSEDAREAFERAVEHQLESDEVIDVLLDLAEVPFVDSTMLECLLDLQDRLAERLGQVKLVQPDTNVRKILEITRLDRTFELYDDAESAVKAIAV